MIPKAKLSIELDPATGKFVLRGENNEVIKVSSDYEFLEDIAIRLAMK